MFYCHTCVNMNKTQTSVTRQHGFPTSLPSPDPKAPTKPDGKSEVPNSPHHNLFYPTNQWVYWKSSGIHPYLKGSWPLVVLVALQDHDMSKDRNPTLFVIVIHLHIIDQLWYTQEIPMCVSEFPARISILVESPCSKFISTAFCLIKFI